MNNHYDIIFIGTGSGGSTMAYKLAPSGKRILILERGGFIPKEKQNWDAHEVVTVGRYRPHEEWLDENDKPFKPFIHYNVGGNSKMYGAALFRFRESDFEQVQHYGGTSPEWPIKYDAYEPYYSIAEQLYSAHGKRGVDPTEPWATSEYPLPPLSYEPLIKELNEKLELLGLQPFPLPMGIKLPQDFTQTESPVMLENFDGFPDPTDSKADGHTMALRPALQHKNVTLITHAYVEKLDTDASGKRVNKVHANIHGEKIIFDADIVIVACGAVNSAALMLRSANEKHPDGLANSSGQVGRNLMLHHNGCLVAFLKDKINDCVFQKSLGIADFYHGAEDSDFPLGEIQLMGRNDEDTILWLAEKIYPAKSYDELKQMTLDFWLTSEDLPSPENRVQLTKEGQIKVYYKRNNYTAYERLKDKLKEVLAKVGKLDDRFADIRWAGYDLDVSGMSHQNGTMRFGTDPQTSVLDLNCRAHDVENLYVVDASFFVSCGAFNPSLTIAANALRVGDHILNDVLKINIAMEMETINR
ncbi:GMC family oxidoreductase [Panacibacter ginsenosidivorans]|uniref:GMC family oxidoreductase n=1 Tax=Panacibacter ginsenosidivorans TaxID=1813871 RepID=A0A5B8VG13_9BACT|nr:GMC family oxidoreductase [Panacibacter ginsenosidivorans]QEC70031.1 GMC family oxidoreductase [Panacibacter ginsenosidivorans]